MPIAKPHLRGRLSHARPRHLWILLALPVVLPNLAPAGNLSGGSEGGLRIVSVKPLSKPAVQRPALVYSQDGPLAGGPIETPPLEGPVMTVAITITDQREGDFEPYATSHAGVSGSALPGATTNVVFGLLDSGSSTHLVSYSAATAVGLQGSFLSGNTFPVSGVDGGSVDLDVSLPVGFFAHGLQDLDAGGNPQPSLMLGQGNFAGGVNTLANYQMGANPPTLIGAPFLLFFPAYIRNSQPVNSSALGNGMSSPSIRFYSNPLDAQIPVLTHKIFLETRPTGTPTVGYLFLFDELPYLPSTILAGLSGGSLFFTASAMSFQEGTNTSSGKMLVDTGAQATLLSEIAATELGLDLQNPDFQVEVQGVVNKVIAPGFYVDSASIPAQGGGSTTVSWANIPVVVLNVGSPEGGTLFGIFGSNLTARRDLVFNGAVLTPYLSITDPIVSPVMKITAIRPKGSNSAEIDWHAEPAPPLLHLERCTDLGGGTPQWQVVATNTLSTINGTMSVTGLGARNFFRLKAP